MDEILEHEAEQIRYEMLHDVLYSEIANLDKTTKYILRHSFGLPRTIDRVSFYRRKDRKEIAEDLKIPAIEVLRLRRRACKIILSRLREEKP